MSGAKVLTEPQPLEPLARERYLVCMSLDQSTEVLRAELARFPRARLTVVKGPDKGLEVVLEGQTVVVGSDESCQLRLTDTSVSRRHLELSGGPGGYRLRDLRSTNGVHFEGVQVMDVRLADKARFRLGRTELRFAPERTEVHWPLWPHDRFGDVLGGSVVMRRLFAVLERAVPSRSPVVLEGERGTGKEALARSVHALGPRREGPFVVVDLAASTEPLMDSDLFGHEVASVRPQLRPGALEEANGGTLYLDEVAALSPMIQGRLLRVLEAGEVRRPGSNGAVKIDVRVVASSERDLDAEVRAGRLREDLFFRLSVFRGRVPPLRERLDDVAMLARHFEARAPGRAGAGRLTEQTLDMLARHDWPGNVRELRNVLERLAAFPDLGASALSLTAGVDQPDGQRRVVDATQALLALPYHDARERVLDTFERTYLTEHLRATNGVVTHAAQRAGLPRQSLHRMLRRLGISSGDDA